MGVGAVQVNAAHGELMGSSQAERTITASPGTHAHALPQWITAVVSCRTAASCQGYATRPVLRARHVPRVHAWPPTHLRRVQRLEVQHHHGVCVHAALGLHDQGQALHGRLAANLRVQCGRG